jgi:hypothetical protein
VRYAGARCSRCEKLAIPAIDIRFQRTFSGILGITRRFFRRNSEYNFYIIVVFPYENG